MPFSKCCRNSSSPTIRLHMSNNPHPPMENQPVLVEGFPSSLEIDGTVSVWGGILLTEYV